MARPKRPSILPDKPTGRGGTYISPYRVQKSNSPATQGRNLSNNSANRNMGYKPNPLAKYTPPNARKTSVNSNNKSRDNSIDSRNRGVDIKNQSRYRSPSDVANSRGGNSPVGSS